jgi:hypothetical protein
MLYANSLCVLDVTYVLNPVKTIPSPESEGPVHTSARFIIMSSSLHIKHSYLILIVKKHY